MKRYFVAGGAGFIGSHLVRHVLSDPDTQVTVFDNFSSGNERHLGDFVHDPRLSIVRGDLKDRAALDAAIAGHDHVYHFASNPDIAKAVTQPDIDFWEGTYLTQNLLEAMRINNVRHLSYASGSGIYGETGTTPVTEDHAPLLPISTYGASKLAGEALICSYCSMFGFNAAAFRFANVVGPNQTHGVGYDFVRKLRKDPTRLHILGDGTQSKSYIYVDDVIAAMRRLETIQIGFQYFNVATEDYLTVRDIADMAVALMHLHNIPFLFAGGERGWRGDIPVVRFDTTKLRELGWSNRLTARQAMHHALSAMIAEPSSDKSLATSSIQY